jgi:hypothetical protein
MMWEKYRRAQKLCYLGWIDGDCIKAGELAALVALELALTGTVRRIRQSGLGTEARRCWRR